MAINKVEFGGNTLIDLTSDTVTADKLLSGYTAHRADGEQITGTYTPSPTPTETLIWENPNPSASFADQDVTLTSGVSNFTSLRVEFYRTTSDRAYICTFSFPVMLPGGTNYMYRTGNSNPKIALSWVTSGGDAYARQGAISSDTKFHFYANRRLNASGTTNTHMIPYRIYGVN